MSDILKVALDRRASLHEEAAKLNEFIRYGESLMRTVQNAETTMFEAPQMANEPRADAAEPATTDVQRPGINRRSA